MDLKSDDFEQQHIFKTKFNDKKHYIEVYGKVNGRANSENKYDYPPPIDNALFFGNMMLLCKANDEYLNSDQFNVDVWKKMYERLFGGFFDLTKTEKEDEEEDELDNIPAEMKIKKGLVNGFIVDDDCLTREWENDEEEEEEDIDENEESSDVSTIDVDSELSEEEYMAYSDD